MDETTYVKTVKAAQRDRRTRARIQANQCVCLAIVTPPSLAADLIDEAIALQTVDRTATRADA